MAWTYGAGTGDDTTFAAAGGIVSGAVAFMCGWVYPTTLTATRTIFSIGNNWQIRIDTTTSELRLVSDNTTDGQWTTTGVGLATGTWKFLAVLVSPLNTGVACAWRVWVGDLTTPPAEVTVTNAVAPSGNFTGATNITFGNAGTGTVAFQGSIESFVFANFNGSANPTRAAFPIAAAGTITQAEANLVRDRYVTPLWRGNLYPYEGAFAGPPSQANTGLNWYVVRTDNTVQLAGQRALRATIGDPPFDLSANNGVTEGPERGPVPPLPGQHVTFRAVHRLR